MEPSWHLLEKDSSIIDLQNATWCTNLSFHEFCVLIQSYKIGSSHVRVYDIVILFFNVLFIVFLMTKLVPTLRKLRLTWPLFGILYCLIFLIPLLCCIRGIFAMIFGHDRLPSKITHYLLRGTILVTEISVVVFGLTIKFYQNSRCKLAVTMIAIITVSIVFFITQLLLDELNVYEPIICKSHHLFTHGGIIFVFPSSVIFAIAYMIIFCLYLFRLYKRWDLPTKKSFYRYALFLSFVNIIKAIGSMLWFYGTTNQVMGHIGVCFTMFATDVYLVTFAPVVYWIFLSNYFRMTHTPDSIDIPRKDSGVSRWLRWSLRPTKAVYIPVSLNHNETSNLIDRNITDSLDSSYSSISLSSSSRSDEVKQ